MCFFADYTLPHIRTPFFVSNSNFDSWSMENILGGQIYYGLSPQDQSDYRNCYLDYSKCNSRFKAALDAWGEAFRDKLMPLLAAPQHGAFVNNCVRHHNIDGIEATTTVIDGQSLLSTVATWVKGVTPAPKLLDRLVPGQNPTC